jgi:F0F1-type ATP synthase membrane subunit c/vacuolar-type H+-ATPase subunit K
MVGGAGSLETAYRHAAITCGAMAASTVLYAVAVAIVSISQAPFEGFAGQMPAGLRLALWTAAAFVAGLIGIVRRTLLGRSPAGDEVAQARRLVSTSITIAALAEVPAVLGLVLFMLSGMRGDFYVLFALSLVLEAAYFPRLEGWRQWAAEPALGC